jgi:hypothetical protein
MNLSATVDDVARRHLARNRNQASALHLPQPLTQTHHHYAKGKL